MGSFPQVVYFESWTLVGRTAFLVCVLVNASMCSRISRKKNLRHPNTSESTWVLPVDSFFFSGSVNKINKWLHFSQTKQKTDFWVPLLDKKQVATAADAAARWAASGFFARLQKCAGVGRGQGWRSPECKHTHTQNFTHANSSSTITLKKLKLTLI